MPISPDEMKLLVPEEPPPVFDLFESELNTRDALRERGEELLERSFLWSRWLTRQFVGFNPASFPHLLFARRLPGYVGVTVGFIPLDDSVPKHDLLPPVAREIGWVFTISVLFDGSPEESGVDPVRLNDGVVFPLVYVPIKRMEHGALNLKHATASCWAKSKKGLTYGAEGVLTAKHAVSGGSRGMQVDMEDGSRGTIADFCSGSVDAALISTRFPSNVTPLNAVLHPVNGDSAYFEGMASGRVDVQIVNSWYVPDNFDPYNSMRVFLDRAGQQGDSGALVREAVSPENPLAIYTGQITTNGAVLGECQYLVQAVELLNIEIFD